MNSGDAKRFDQLKKNFESSSVKENGDTPGDLIGSILSLPGLRGFWPMSSVNESGNPYDISGQARTMTNTGSATFGLSGMMPYSSTNGSTQYFTRASESGLAITGNLTICGWFHPTALPAINSGATFESKLGASGSYSYLLDLYNLVSGPDYRIRMLVSGTGSDFFVSQSSGSTQVTTGKWLFACGRYIPSTEVAVWYNSEKQVYTTAIPASIYNSTSAFTISSRSPGTSLFQGYSSMCFLCAYALSDRVIKSLFSIGRVFFGI